MGRRGLRLDAQPLRPVGAVRLDGIDPLPADAEARARASSAWYTPRHAAAVLGRMARCSWLSSPGVVGAHPWRVLEPSAGTGALIDALAEDGMASSHTVVDAIELDQHVMWSLTERAWPMRVRVECSDYLTRPAPERPYDLAIMNPPYERGLDSLFLAKAMHESLRVVALVRLALLESQRSYERIWSRIGGAEGWRLIELRPFVVRPLFVSPAIRTSHGKTAFMAVKLSRIEGCNHGTNVNWYGGLNGT